MKAQSEEVAKGYEQLQVARAELQEQQAAQEAQRRLLEAQRQAAQEEAAEAEAAVAQAAQARLDAAAEQRRLGQERLEGARVAEATRALQARLAAQMQLQAPPSRTGGGGSPLGAEGEASFIPAAWPTAVASLPLAGTGMNAKGSGDDGGGRYSTLLAALEGSIDRWRQQLQDGEALTLPTPAAVPEPSCTLPHHSGTAACRRADPQHCMQPEQPQGSGRGLEAPPLGDTAHHCRGTWGECCSRSVPCSPAARRDACFSSGGAGGVGAQPPRPSSAGPPGHGPQHSRQRAPGGDPTAPPGAQPAKQPARRWLKFSTLGGGGGGSEERAAAPTTAGSGRSGGGGGIFSFRRSSAESGGGGG